MKQSLNVHFLTITESRSSEHIYKKSLQDKLRERGINPVRNWKKADVVHLFEVNFFSRAAARAFQYPKLFRILRSDTPVVVSTDDLYFLDEPSLTAWPSLYSINHYTQRWLFDKCDAVVAISNSVHDALEKYLPSSKIHVVRHGVDERYYTEKESQDSGYVFHVSLASKRKNPQAVKRVAEQLSCPFIIAGSGWDKYIPENKKTENVSMVGFVPEDELISLYKRASIFYFPTLHEGFGLPVLEAMAARNAVVTSNVYSVPEVADGAAVLCNPNDVDTHVSEIESLYTNPDLRQELAEKGVERAKEFTWDKAAKKTVNVYRCVLEDSSY